MKVGYLLVDGHAQLLALAPEFPQIQFLRIDDAATLRRHASDIEAVVVFGFRHTAEVASILQNECPKLRWLQWANAGLDSLLRHGVPKQARVTYAPTVWGPTVSEHAVALLLGLARQMPQLERDRARAAWNREPRAHALQSLEGKFMVCMGFGTIGRGIATRARAFGMRVVAIGQTTRDDPDVEKVLSLDRLDEVLPQADALVLAIPSTAATRGIIDRRRLATMKRTAFLVNVARGDITDEAALCEALAEGRLAGAGLDAFSLEPLPSDHPFWRLDNVILSPHIAGNGGSAYERLAELFRTNLQRYLAGEPLLYPIPE